MSTFLKMDRNSRSNRMMALANNVAVEPDTENIHEIIGLSEVVDVDAFTTECLRVFLNPLGENVEESGLM